ncbi:MAG: DUF4142 domain-containing protein [Myxococcota bacterium]
MRKILGFFAMGALLVAGQAIAQTNVQPGQQPGAQPGTPQATQPGMGQKDMGKTAGAGSDVGTKISDADKKFIKKAAEDGLREVELGRMMVDKATTPEVKQFAQMMVEHHSRTNDQLRQIAQQKGVEFPTAVDNDMLNKLQKMSGNKLEKEYISNMVKDHRKDVDYFEKQADKVKDPDLKQFVNTTLPTLQQHLSEAQRIKDTLGQEKGKTSIKPEEGTEKPRM